MALAAVLSAVRELILETDDIADDETLRRESYRARFSKLSLAEIEDLAKIEPKKIKTYTSTIFNGEKNVLKDLFSGTITLLEKYWPDFYNQPFNLYTFTKDLNRKQPWKGTATVVLAEGFVRYLEESCAAMVARHSELLDIARFELLSMKVRRTPDPVKPEGMVTREQLPALTVADLMALRFKISDVAKFTSFGHDLVTPITFYHQHERFPDELEARRCYAVIGRNHMNRLRWRELPQAVYEYLNLASTGDAQPIEELAQAYASSAPEIVSETELFSGFIALLVGLMDDGVLVALP